MDFSESKACVVGNKDENKEELLRQAIALSEENEEENDEEELLRLLGIALSLQMIYIAFVFNFGDRHLCSQLT